MPAGPLRPVSSEFERDADRAAPEPEVAQCEAGRVAAGPAEAAEVAHVTAKADVVREEADDAASDVHAEVVLRIDVEHGGHVLHLRARSEERRVGKEGRSRWSPYH